MSLPDEIIYLISLECNYGVFSICKKYHGFYDDLWFENFFAKKQIKSSPFKLKDLYYRYIDNRIIYKNITGIKRVKYKDIIKKNYNNMILQYDGKLLINTDDFTYELSDKVVDIVYLSYLTLDDWYIYVYFYGTWVKINEKPGQYKKLFSLKIYNVNLVCATTDDGIDFYKLTGWYWGQKTRIEIRNVDKIEVIDDEIVVVDEFKNTYFINFPLMSNQSTYQIINE